MVELLLGYGNKNATFNLHIHIHIHRHTIYPLPITHANTTPVDTHLKDGALHLRLSHGGYTWFPSLVNNLWL